MNARNSTSAGTMPAMNSQPSSPDMGWLNNLPHHDSVELDADETAPRTARKRLAKLLPQWSLPQYEIAASLVASELLTNSMIATRETRWTGPLPPIRLWLRGGPSVMAILTWDVSLAVPTPRVSGDDDESGRGLAIVAGLSAAWGFYYPAEFPGKVTWSIITTPL